MNIVHLHDYAERPRNPVPAPSARIVHECRELVIERLVHRIPQLMDRVDDTLFDLADKAENNRIQSEYFEAMREVRLKRPGMEAAVRESISGATERALSGETGGRAAGGPEPASGSELGLVEHDELEESLALTNMVARLKSLAKRELFACDRRIGHLLGVADLDEGDNPIGPEALCNAFRDACSTIESGIKIKLIVLKLLDKHVVGEIPALYEEINALLVKHGVLPEIHSSVKKRPAPRRSRGADAPAPGADGDAADGRATGSGAPARGGGWDAYHDVEPGADRSGTAPGAGRAEAGPEAGAGAGAGAAGPAAAVDPQMLFETLRALMTVGPGAIRAGGGAPAAAAGSAGNADAGGGVGGAVIGDLTRLQRDALAPGGGPGASGADDRAGAETGGETGGETGAGAGVPGDAGVLRDLKSSGIGRQIGPGGDAVIDLVAMMFDFILDDRRLPDPMRALIGRLQIPVLKVAMLDREFFSRRFHPVRKFLNTLAEAAIGWGEEHAEGDALHEEASRLVARVLDEFDDDVALFAELLEALESFLEQDRERAEREAEEEARAVEERERYRIAKAITEDRVGRRVAESSLPGVLRDFLHGYWKDFLIVTYVHEGEESEEWKGAIETMDTLIWSVTPKATAEERKALLESLPTLVKRLNKGIRLASMPAEERERLTAELARYQAAAVRPAGAVPVPRAADEPPSEAAAEPAGSGDAEDAAGEPGSTAETPLARESALLKSAVEEANTLIHGAAARRAECRGMGTTVVAAVFRDNAMHVAHAGDSRLYRTRGGALERITLDHSLVQELINKGFLTPEEARESRRKNLVTRALGPEPTVLADVQCQPVQTGDRYLLCSDGLTDLVPDEEIAALLESGGEDLRATAAALVEAANAAGGRDNVSVILADVHGAFEAPDDGSLAPALDDLVEIVTITDVGMVRSHNEDSVGSDPRLGVAVLADGMGGANAGEVASAMAVTKVLKTLQAELGDETAESTRGADTDPFEDVFEGADAAAPADARLADVAETYVEEITIGDVGDLPEERDEEDEFTSTAGSLEVGSWVEFRREGGDKTRARLAWVSPATGTFLFADRQGRKVLDATVRGLAVELRRGSASVIEDVPLFDRAMSKLTARLKSGIAASA